MKLVRRLLVICGCWLLWVSVAGAQDVTIRRVTDRVITLSMSNLSMHTNVTVIETRKGLVCIETEFVPSVMKTINKAAEKELGRNDWAYVINSHGHLHHAGGNAAFPDTPIIGPEKMMMDRLKRQLSSKEGRKAYCDFAGLTYGINMLRRNLAQARLTGEQRETLRRRLRFCYAIQKEIMAGFEVRNPTIAHDELNELDMGDTHLRLIYWGDGISHSSIFVHVVEDNLLVGMGMGGERWLPGFNGKTSLENIRHTISVFKGLCDENFRIDVMIGIHKPDVKKSLESDYPRPEAVALRPIHGFATAISTAFFRQSQMPLTTPKGRGLLGLIKQVEAAFSTGTLIPSNTAG